jgi:peroxiredoxin Q/BCP
LRLDYAKFQALDSEVIALGPDGPNAFKRYWEENQMPFIGLADIHSKVAEQYQQEVNLFKLGRMPAQVIVDRQGKVRYSHYGDSMSDIPENDTILALIEKINTE